MFCIHCGVENPDGSRFCSDCGQAIQAQQPLPYPAGRAYINNNLVWAILSTIFCCWPAGIVAIVYAARVNGKLATGDYATAQQYANNAMTWSIISLVLGLVVVGLFFFLVVVMGLASLDE